MQSILPRFNITKQVSYAPLSTGGGVADAVTIVKPPRDVTLLQAADQARDSFKKDKKTVDLEEAIKNYQRALREMRSRDQGHLDTTAKLIDLYCARGLTTKTTEDVDKAIDFYRKSAYFRSRNYPLDPSYRHALAQCHSIRYSRKAEREDLDHSIQLHEYALDDSKGPLEDNALRFTILRELGDCYGIRFNRYKGKADIEAAIERCREAHTLDVAKNWKDRWAALDGLGRQLLARYRAYAQDDDVREAIDCHNKALELTPQEEGIPFQAKILRMLGLAHKEIYEKSGLKKDNNLVHAINHYLAAITLLGTDSADIEVLEDLASHFWASWNRSSNPIHLDHTITLGEKVLQLYSTSDPGYILAQSQLAVSLTTRFHHAGDVADINKAVRLNNDVIRRCPIEHPHHFKASRRLAISLH